MKNENFMLMLKRSKTLNAKSMLKSLNARKLYFRAGKRPIAKTKTV